MMHSCLTMPFTPSSLVRQMSSEEQRQTAIELASAVLPLAELTPLGQPPQGLGPIADAIRARTSITAVAEARHALLAMPESGEEEEPEGLAWYTFGTSVAWVFAADANTTSPADGVIHTFNRVSDLLEAIDEDLGDTGLMNQLLQGDERHGQNKRVLVGACRKPAGGRRSTSLPLTGCVPADW